MSQSPAEQLVGAVLNRRFKLIRLLGEGGMGAVYEADCAEGKRAVKVLHEEFNKIPEVRQRFFAEAQATQNMSHPNIVSVLESAVAEDGSPYIVMELLRGESLGDRLAERNSIPLEEAWPILRQTLSALSAAHAARVVHRDLKPDNVFLTKDQNGNDFVRLLDFGIAKIMDAAGGMGSKTRTGALIGTAGYMSPEQIKSAKTVDLRTDLWAMSTMLFQMLTGALPFRGDDEFTRLTAVIVGQPTPIESIAPQYARLSPFFQRAFTKDVNERFQTAEEMSQALAAIMNPPASPKTSAGTAIMSASMFVTPAPVQPAPMAGSLATADTSPANTPPQQRPVNPLAVTAPAPYAPPGHTRISSEGHGAPVVITPMTPQVQIVAPSAPSKTLPEQGLSRPGAPWWLVGVIAAVCLGLGFVAGYLAGR